MNRRTVYIYLTLMALVSLMWGGCASMGRPEGGPRDSVPPVFVRSNPAPGSLNVNRDRITIEFDENVQVKDVMDKVVVSPTQKSMPKVSAVGRRVTVELVDSLVPDATYTIDFTDAISDLNEGNPLDGFAFDFATGNTIDTLCISGMVFQAENLEAAQSMLVGVHSNLADSAIRTLPFDRVTRTNQYGQFTIRNLKPGTYNVFAINDINRDNRWDRTEDIAYYPLSVTPSASRVMRSDTLTAEDGSDSILVHEVTAFYPNDLLLTWFNENYKRSYLSKYERPERNVIDIEMGAPAADLPKIKIVGGEFDGRDFAELSVAESSPTHDTIRYWIADTALMAIDTLTIEARYLKTDSLDQLVETPDTLRLVYKAPKNKNKKSGKKKEDKKALDAKKLDKDKKDKKDGDNDGQPGSQLPADSAALPADTAKAPPVDLLKIIVKPSSTADVYSTLDLEFPEPLARMDSDAFHLEIMLPDDTIWEALPTPRFAMIDSLQPRFYRAPLELEPGAKYRLTGDSLAVTGLYGLSNGTLTQEFSVKELNEYGNIRFRVSGLNGQPAVVQILSNQDKPVASQPVIDGVASFQNLNPAVYFARLYIDRNQNGLYDNGSLTDSVQPEDVYYFSKKINLKKNWDIEQNWDINELPVDLQKPNEIKKNKPKLKGNQNQLGDEEEDEEYYDEFGNPAVDPDDPFGKRKNQRYKNMDQRDNMMNGGQGAGYRRGGYR